MRRGRVIAFGLALAACLPWLPTATTMSAGDAIQLRSMSLAQNLEKSGYRFDKAIPLTAGSSHHALAYQQPQTGCVLLILAADPPDEALSLAKARLRDEYWSKRFLWLGGFARPAEEPWRLHLLRLWTRLIDGPGDATPHLIIPNSQCPKAEAF